MKAWIVAGNLTRAAKVESKDNGRDMLIVAVACNEGPNRTTFVDVICWGKKGFANGVLPHLAQGQAVVCSGKIFVGQRAESNGVSYPNVHLSLDNLFGLQLIGGSRVAPADSVPPSDQVPPAAQDASASNQQAAEQMPADYDSFDDDIPF